MTRTPRTGLVLTGGGARAAYQVGVLKAISDMMPDLHYPFPVICGTSAGAINAVGLACGQGIFRHTISHVESLWTELQVSDIYRSDTLGMARWFSMLMQSMLKGQPEDMPASLLDNRPLREYLARELPLELLGENLDAGNLHAVGVTACGYSGGQSICFFQGQPDIPSWNQGQRLGVRCELGLDHLMASSAIPVLFPPVRIHREYFGDGATRQMAHISPALYLGADQVLVIGVSANRICPPVRRRAHASPTIAQIMEHVLNGLFLDTLEFDVDRLLLINQLVELIPRKKLLEAGLDFRMVNLLEISPSQPIDELAVKHLKALPAMLRRIIWHSLAAGDGGTSLASYLLFDKGFCSDLIRLGYLDAQAHARQLTSFLQPAS